MPPKGQSKLSFGKSTSSSSSSTPAIELDTPEPDSQSSIQNTNTSEPFDPLPTKEKKRKERKSWVYKYMRGGVGIQYIFLNDKGKEEWRCKFCTQNYVLTGGTGIIGKYLEDVHDIKEDSPAEKRAKNI
jgi:hypothetical protein